MTNSNKMDNEKIGEWMYDFAWKQLENAQLCNDGLDNKSINNITFASLIIPIIAGIQVYIYDKMIVESWGFVLMVVSLIILLMSLFFAYRVLWLKDQGVIRTCKHFDAIDGYDLEDIIEGTSIDLANWQKKIVDASERKSNFLWISNYLFITAVVLIVISFGVTLFV